MADDRPYHKTPSALDVLRKRAAEDAAHNAVQVVERWNAERSPLWSPTIRCAITAGKPWLEVYCPGCRTSRAIDIRTVDRHLLASVGSLVLGLRCCRRARPQAATRTADLEYLQVRPPPRMARPVEAPADGAAIEIAAQKFTTPAFRLVAIWHA